MKYLSILMAVVAGLFVGGCVQLEQKPIQDR